MVFQVVVARRAHYEVWLDGDKVKARPSTPRQVLVLESDVLDAVAPGKLVI